MLFTIVCSKYTQFFCNLGSFGYDGNPLIDTPNFAKTTSKGRHIYVYHVNVSPPGFLKYQTLSHVTRIKLLLRNCCRILLMPEFWWSIYFHTPTSKMLPEKHNHMNSCCTSRLLPQLKPGNLLMTKKMQKINSAFFFSFTLGHLKWMVLRQFHNNAVLTPVFAWDEILLLRGAPVTVFISNITLFWTIHNYQSGQITGSGTVPNLVQVSRIWYIQSHNASDRPKLFQISNWQIKEEFQSLLKVFTRISFYVLKIIV